LPFEGVDVGLLEAHRIAELVAGEIASSGQIVHGALGQAELAGDVGGGQHQPTQYANSIRVTTVSGLQPRCVAQNMATKQLGQR
jgi:hypothetical protein